MAYYVRHDPRGCSEALGAAAAKLHRDTLATVEYAVWNVWRVDGVPLQDLAEWLDEEGFDAEVCTLYTTVVVHAA